MDIQAFLKAKITERVAQHLKIIILHEDGTPCAVYPKDQATKQRWLTNYARKGVVVVES